VQNNVLTILAMIIGFFSLLLTSGLHAAITEENRLTEAESEELVKALGFPFTQIGFIDSRNGAVVHMINETA